MTGKLFVNAILPDLKVNSQKQAFQQVTEQAAQDTGLNQKRLMSRLLTWEGKSISSGIGNGVAIPQLTIGRLKRPYALFARLPQAIDYNSVDGEPVDLIFLLLSPKSDGPYHLQRLAKISRLLRDQNLCSSLRSTNNFDALKALLLDPVHRQVAA